MRLSIAWFKWHIQRIWFGLTAYQLVAVLVLLWLVGMWSYILPMYYQRINELRVENNRLTLFIERYEYLGDVHSPVKQLVTKQPYLSYADLLALSAKHELTLVDYRELGTALQKQYQITVKGTWLNSRLLLGELQADTFAGIEILSLDLQRDRLTNEVNLNLLLSEPVRAIP